MEFSIVRSDEAGCEPNCAEWIAAQGQIVKGSTAALTRTINSLRGKKLPILVHSTGGDVDEGLRMGQLIRDKGLDVVVAQTHPAIDCKPRDAVCLKQVRAIKGPRPSYYMLNRSLCASACTFVLAGGVRRVALMGANIGVHQVTATRTKRMIYRRYYVERRRINGKIVEVSRRLISERVVSQKTTKLKSAPEATNKRIEAHFTKMGLDPAFFALTMATAADDTRYLSQAEIHAQKVGTHGIGEVISANPTYIRVQPNAAPVASAPQNASVVTPPVVGSSNTPSQSPKKDPVPFTGYILLGDQSAEIRLEPETSNNRVKAFFNLMERGQSVSTAGLSISFDMQDGFTLVALPLGAAPSDQPAKNLFERAQFCSVDLASGVTISLRETSHDAPRWKRSAPASELMPMTGIRAALCP